jgi:Polyketide cyclase / dehydrase and lipid transport
MMTKDLRFAIFIKGSPETIFDLAADMPNYGTWLPDSSAFGGTVEVTPYPVRLGTTYLDAGPIQKPGSVTEYDRPRHISFHHTVQLRRSFLNTDIDARIRYTFEPGNGGTHVDRRLALTFNLPGVSSLAMPLLLYGFRKENNRTLAALKRYVEAQAT